MHLRASYAFTELTNVFAGLNAGMLCSGIMIVVFFDFAPGDKQAGYFAELFKNDIRPDKKWSNQATQYILTEDENGDCSRSFKTFLTCVEHSNRGFTTQWGDNFGQQFKGKLVGGVYVHRWITMMAERWKRGCFVVL